MFFYFLLPGSISNKIFLKNEKCLKFVFDRKDWCTRLHVLSRNTSAASTWKTKMCLFLQNVTLSDIFIEFDSATTHVCVCVCVRALEICSLLCVFVEELLTQLCFLCQTNPYLDPSRGAPSNTKSKSPKSLRQAALLSSSLQNKWCKTGSIKT